MVSIVAKADNNTLLPPPLSPRPQYDSVDFVVPTTQQYIAIRNGCLPPNGPEVDGRIIRNCIFSNWDDAKIFLQGPDSQYEICNAIEDAVQFAFRQYLGNNMKTSQDGQGAKGSSGEDAHAANDNVGKENTCCVSSLMKKNKEQPPEDLLISTALRMREISEPIDPSASVQSCDVEKVITGNNDNVNVSTATSSSQKASNSINNNEALFVCGTSAVSVIDGGNRGNQPPKKKKRNRNVQSKSNDPNSKAQKSTRFDWEEQFAKLKEYYKHHGTNASIKNCPENATLLKWVMQQRRDYKELQSKGKSKLTTSQMQQLNDIGFKFLPRGIYVSWDQRMREFLEFKRVNGHTNVPTSHPVLGPWLMNQRRQYKRVMKNDPHCRLTQDQIKQMREAGFIFEAGKPKSDSRFDGRTRPKSWDERFEELKEFKAKHGHTIVPQNYPQLGWWVHDQRKEYKKLSKNLKSKISTAKVLKLIEIGFVFDASGHKANMIRNDPNDGDSESENVGDSTVYDDVYQIN